MKARAFERCFDKIRVWVSSVDAPVKRMRESRTDEPFRIAVATILSPRTTDVILKQVIDELFRHIHEPHDLLRMPLGTLRGLIRRVGFYRNKAKALKGFAKEIVGRFQGKVPDRMEDLLSLPGIGIKVAAIILVEGYGKNAISVDTHVHRIMNRLGVVATKTPEQTCKRLYQVLPERLWSPINFHLVAFGQTVCRPIGPKCSTCPVERSCPKIGI